MEPKVVISKEEIEEKLKEEDTVNVTNLISEFWKEEREECEES